MYNPGMELIGITRRGRPAVALDGLCDITRQVLEATADMYHGAHYKSPWIGYLAVDDGKCVGTCAFKTPPRENQVEIAFFTYPEHEGRGIATRMAEHLVHIARTHVPTIVISAQTLPVENASGAVLRKLGFTVAGEIEHPFDGRVWEWKLIA